MSSDAKESVKQSPTTSTSNIKNQLPAAMSTSINRMDKVTPSVLKTVIEGILLLSLDNYNFWRIRVINFLDLCKLKKALTTDEDKLNPDENDFLKAIIVAKLESTVQANVVDSLNKDCAKKTWKSIIKFFASTQTSNKAHVFQSFL
ncbi:hypothetical protein PTTG_30649 [Puccinia triticina 1-1 BBBD Race 1]|uniref:DUF4219 domain-containing protein n=1 Tax=Puccinia triticina (isolate 1-1 / race 1 (BBBD)) TaxID=630390 RepID=A0A180FXW9_PUCT1|nr:hypothetical protein PTTG_30649 [Puccinia triticina 1-1 BBBD Race 1]